MLITCRRAREIVHSHVDHRVTRGRTAGRRPQHAELDDAPVGLRAVLGNCEHGTRESRNRRRLVGRTRLLCVLDGVIGRDRGNGRPLRLRVAGATTGDHGDSACDQRNRHHRRDREEQRFARPARRLRRVPGRLVGIAHASVGAQDLDGRNRRGQAFERHRPDGAEPVVTAAAHQGAHHFVRQRLPGARGRTQARGLVDGCPEPIAFFFRRLPRADPDVDRGRIVVVQRVDFAVHGDRTRDGVGRTVPEHHHQAVACVLHDLAV